jgi:hypothetical protein
MKLDISETELNLIAQLCNQATVQGFEQVSLMMGLMTKIRALAEKDQRHPNQKSLDQEYHDNV